MARSVWPPGVEWVSTEHLHAERGHARLLRSGCAGSGDAGPGYPSSPKEQRGSRREDQQADRPAPASPPESCTWAVAGQRACGRSRAHSRPPGLVPPSLCGPDGEHAPLAEITLRRRPQSSTGSRRGPAQTSRGCDSRRPPGLPGEKEGLGLPHASTGARTRWTVRGGAALQERDAPQPPPRAPAARQSSDALPPDVRPATDRSGSEGEARLVLDRD